MTRFARAEREALCDTFLAVGPAAPTLCGSWTTADLAVHLVVRDGRPDLMIGPRLPIVGTVAKKQLRQLKAQPWPDLVEAVRSGPPLISPTALGPVDELVNLIECFVHHEDVLRAEPGVERRGIPEAEQRALWAALERVARLMFRRAAVGVELISPTGRIVAKKATPMGSVAIEGAAGELVLAAYGRYRAADVTTRGSDEAVAALWGSKLGLG
ncbi:MAG: TIGR03085 family metal-binding protein [Nostocoides sp.]|uniref:TIGR03085 family metal-binding protein n=1 Tax=Nostocoides sp. TaxID=1917966 RepID=UPI003C71F432